MRPAYHPFRGRPLRWTDAAVGLVLAAAYLALVMGTNSMGFTRDESFYHGHAKTYLAWLMKLWNAEDSEARDKVLGRDEVKKAWRNNSEHPPLMKVMFGLSWRFLGKKLRNVKVAENGTVEIQGLGITHGFEVGDRVPLLLPVALGGDVRSDARTIGLVEVTERKNSGARGLLLDSSMEVGELALRCAAAQARPDEIRYQVPCQVRTDGPLQVLWESDAFRLPGALSGALLILLMFLFGVEVIGGWASLLAALMFALLPRAFFHAHLTCFDMPITAASFAVLYAFWKSLRSTRWAVMAGVLWGVALLVKLNAFFVPVTLLLWWLVANVREFRVAQRHLHLPRFPIAFLFMPALGLPMVFLLWPWLWYDSIQAFGKYMAFHLGHEHYFTWFFGEGYQYPPFPVSYPFVMTWYTVPVLTMLLFLAGFATTYLLPLAARLLGGGRGRPGDGQDTDSDFWRGSFIMVNMLIPIGIIALPSTPIFGGVKHWLLTMPFFCWLAGVALVQVLRLAGDGLGRLGWRWADKEWSAGLVGAGAAALVLLLLAPAASSTLASVTYGLSYYNEWLGGAQGAARSHQQRQYWSYASRGTMEWVSRNAPYGTVVDFQDATPGTCDMLRWDGLMRYDLKCASRIGNPELLLFDVEERFSEEEIRLWPRMDTVGPVYEAAVDGVPMVRVYQKHAGCETVLNQHALSLPSPTGGGDFHAGGREPRGEGGWDAQGGDVEAGEGDIMEHDAEELEP